ncbi:MAG: YraN family protein [Woeseiaceae bacterium]|nr:YraN family protein [Woeseiaceae bacterium]NIP21225.1 YraN family protein [Woeseiaceae bacterium]NIS90197.1 YraN family protein [Woeseiaceae bacterium]
MARVDTRTLGATGEQLAQRFLARQGLVFVDRNFRCRLGEIDLIARDSNCLLFIEVRYRGVGSYSPAGPTVNVDKQRKLIRTAALYLAKRPQYANCVMRFDVIAIDADDQGKCKIEWIKDAFRPNDSRL